MPKDCKFFLQENFSYLNTSSSSIGTKFVDEFYVHKFMVDVRKLNSK